MSLKWKWIENKLSIKILDAFKDHSAAANYYKIYILQEAIFKAQPNARAKPNCRSKFILEICDKRLIVEQTLF